MARRRKRNRRNPAITPADLRALLTFERVPWKIIDDHGFSVRAIADEAGNHGDVELRKKAMAYLNRKRRGKK